jgi:haloacetate dehalogenase
MANDQVAFMRALDHDSFAVVGHDRGARVTHRMVLDHPDAVERAAVIDIVPTRHVFGHVDRLLATVYDHWFFLAEPPDLPEVLIGGAPEYFLRRKLDQWSGPNAAFDDDAMADYVRCFSDPDAIRGSCEDYRAGASIDLEHDEASYAAGRRVACPLLVLWGAHGFVGLAYDPLAVWRDYAEDDGLVSGHAVDAGHFVPEEAPAETVAALTDFLA